MFSPGSPSDSDEVYVYMCVQGFGGINNHLLLYANTATDGSASGDWYWIDPKGNFCYDPSDPTSWPQWHTRALADGTHLIRAVGTHGSPPDPFYVVKVKETTYTLNFRRPSNTQLVNPPQNGWLNTRTVAFRWYPEQTQRVESFTFRVSQDPNPNVNPIIDLTLGPTTYAYTATLDADYPSLYWGVQACNWKGCSDMAIGHFGIDREAPTAAVDGLSPIVYETVLPVSWGGNDSPAGIRWYDVQYRDGERGEWTDWMTAVTDTNAIFQGQAGHTYCFRARALDNAGNQGTYPGGDGDTCTLVDPTAAPPTPWWDANYALKRNILVLNNDGGTLPVGYPIHLHFDGGTTPTAAEMYSASQSAVKGDDFRIVYQDAQELSRFVQSFTPERIDIWFKTQAAIPPLSSDAGSYQLYYGNPAAANPPGDIDQVMPPGRDANTAGLWHFQEGGGTTVHDSSGNNRHATILTQTGGNWQWGWYGKFGGYLQFFNQPQDGDGAWAEVSNGSGFDLVPITVEALVRRESGDVERVIVAKRYGSETNWKLFLQDWKPAFEYRYTRIMANDALPLNTWAHVAGTYDGAVLRLYVNGQLVKEQAVSVTPPADGSPLRFGKSADHSEFLNGSIQHIRISNVARSNFSSIGALMAITVEPALTVGGPIGP
ncbi:MAG: LamG-like jellyroll fold domain-containing protein [Chloroflexia bacterium]